VGTADSMSEYSDPVPSPDDPGHQEALADEASEESFPSSDPPSTYAGPDEATSRAESAPDEAAPDDPDD
jgi:hypothetical protein